jgi:hypothetical protein
MSIRPAAVLGLALSCTAFAHEDSRDLVLATSTDLRDWCQRASEARLVGERKTPSNWTARHYEKGNTLMVDGKWRVAGREVEVHCRAGRGTRAEFATVEIMAGD